MKKTIRTVAFIAVFGMVATACQKEPMLNLQTATINEETAINVTYTVDGMTSQASFSSDEEWQTFLSQLFVWAVEGRSVVFCNAETMVVNTKQTREIVTFTTTNENEAGKWADDMRKEGYKVYITFDSESGIFTCIAVR